MALRLFALSVLPFLTAAVRLEGEILKEVDDQDQSAQWFRSSNEAEEPDKVADEEASNNADGGSDKLSLEDQCANAAEGGLARNSSWRRWNLLGGKKCKCPKHLKLSCKDEDCEENGRYYNPQNKKGLQCTCAKCAYECNEIVTGAVWRKSAWIRYSQWKCKCEKGNKVKGDNAECQEMVSGDEKRHFAKKDLRGKGCRCADENETPAPTPAPSPDTTLQAREDGGGGAVATGASGLILLLAAIAHA